MNENYKKLNRIPSSSIVEYAPGKRLPSSLKGSKDQSFLFLIAVNFGFNEKESVKLIEEVYANHQSPLNKGKSQLPLKLCLSKLMVQKCIFKISSRIFSGDRFPGSEGWLTGYSNSNIFQTRQRQMPLSYLTAYILSNAIGFSDADTAFILNITVQQVKERLQKADQVMRNRS